MRTPARPVEMSKSAAMCGKATAIIVELSGTSPAAAATPSTDAVDNLRLVIQAVS